MRCKTLEEFKYFTIHTPGGWREGWGESVFVDRAGHLSLAPVSPVGQSELGRPTGIAVDGKGDLFIIDAEDCQIYKLAPEGGTPRRLGCLDAFGCQAFACRDDSCRQSPRDRGLFGCGGDSGQFEFTSGEEASGGLAFGRETLYVADPFNHRVQGFSLPEFQLRLVLGRRGPCGYVSGTGKGEFDRPKDVVADGKENLYVLDYGNRRIQKFNRLGRFVRYVGAVGEHRLEEPEGFAVGKDGSLYVVDGGRATVERFGPDGAWQETAVKWPDDIPEQFRDAARPTKPSAVAVDEQGIVYVGERGEGVLSIHLFDPKLDPARKYPDRYLRYLGRLGEYAGGCFKLVIGRDGHIYASCRESGVLLFGGEGGFQRQGTYYSKVFDCTVEACAWHRLDLDVQTAEKSSLKSFFRASDTPFDRDEKETTLLPWLPLFETPQGSVAVEDALFKNAVGRYLQLKLVFDGDAFHTHRVKQARIYFERNSYLRYLPATYQESEEGRDFLERFLSIFESMSLEVEQEIDGVAKYFDPRAVDGEFLDWLGTWLAVLRDYNWPEEKRRELLRRAFRLYSARGTARGLVQLVELLTGGRASVVEHHRLRTPIVLGADPTLGLSTVVGRASAKRLVLEESSRIGEFSLIEADEPPERPFEAGAFDFTLVADTSGLADEAQERALRRLVEEEKPSHTRFFLRTGGGVMRLGQGALLQVDTRLSKGFETARLGLTSRVGTGTFLGKKFRRRGVIGTRSTITVDAVLH
ncbi:MAG TPA: phage tail protein [Pyrinomonadaceae bacterium]|jgi:phage tail-like protein|nr:phage tail protein [Pyrinomonadaceae bacterium]